MVRNCLLCKRYSEPDSNLSFHKFPKDSKLRKTWLNVLGLEEDSILKNSSLCSNHFSSADFILKSSGVRNLKKDAIPLLASGSMVQPTIKQFLEEESMVTGPLSSFGTLTTSESRKLDESEMEKYVESNIYILRKPCIMKSASHSTSWRLAEQTSETMVLDDSGSEDENSSILTSSDVEERMSSTPPQSGNISFLDVPDQQPPDKSCRSSHENYTQSSSTREPTSKSPLQDENSSQEEASSDELSDFEFNLTCSDLEPEIEKEKAKLYTKRRKKPLPQTFDDISPSDMDNPYRARICLKITKQTLLEIQKKYKKLQRRNHFLNKTVHFWKSFFIYLEGNDFLNEHARAVVKAVLSRDTEPP